MMFNIFKCTERGREGTPHHFFVRPHMTSQFTIISSGHTFFFVRHCLHSFSKNFSLFHTKFDPCHVVYNGSKYFILGIKQFIEIFISYIIPRAKQNRLVCSLPKICKFLVVDSKNSGDYHLKVAV